MHKNTTRPEITQHTGMYTRSEVDLIVSFLRERIYCYSHYCAELLQYKDEHGWAIVKDVIRYNQTACRVLNELVNHAYQSESKDHVDQS